jgi:hypothetical protein
MRGAQNKGLYYRAVKMQSKQQLPIAYLFFPTEEDNPYHEGSGNAAWGWHEMQI